MRKFANGISLVSVLAAGLAGNTAMAQDDFVLEEIIVTAQKREQSLQDVPISVATYKGDRIRDLVSAGGDIRALSGYVPGLNIESSNGRVAPRFYIRGLGNTDFDLAASQPVSIIMDDVVMENVVLKSFPLFDIERVEVLRGPQGTLFGRNTPAGIVKFDTVKPGAEEEGYVAANLGSYGTKNLEFGYTLPMGEKLSVRLSSLYSGRSDWIDNGYTGETNAMGGFDEFAGRVQVAYDFSDNFSGLLRLHARNVEGTSSLFRANILTTGSNELNANYDRDMVWYDAGNNNPQEYSQEGASLKLTWDADDLEVVSITAFETADGYSLGDIDGGFGAVYLPEMGPGFIPFDSQTQDNVDDTNQLTQEFRVASTDDSALQWQYGFYYFESDLSVTTNPFFVGASTVQHKNEAWAVFGQVAYDINADTTLTVGSRFTDDSRELVGFPGWAPIEINAQTGDNRVTWDVALNHAVTDDTTVFARVASGFRAPSIQGRDIAFFGAPSVAKSETIMSYETGVKGTFADGRARYSAAAYIWDMKDQQISAVGGAGNLIQLVNADKTEGYGLEIDLEYMPVENLLFVAGYAYNHTAIKDPAQRVGLCGSGQCTSLDPVDQNGFAQVYGNPLPQAPNWVASFTARYDVDMGNGNNLFFATDWFLEGKKNLFIYESAEYRTSGDFEGGLRVGYEWEDGKYQVSAFARNITNESNLKGGIDFNNNTAFVNEPRVFGVSFRGDF